MIEYEFAKQNELVEIKNQDGKIYILSKYPLDSNSIDKIIDEIGKDVEFIFDKRYNFNKIFEESYSIVVTDVKINSEFKDILSKDIESLFTYIMKKPMISYQATYTL